MSQLLDITVITVCFNCEEEIEKTIESVYRQKKTDYEYIIQDGKSSDDTVKRAEAYKSKFANKNIEFTVYAQKDRGIYHAMNLAAAKSKGKYLLFLNAGDVLCHDNVFQILDIACRKSNADVFYGDTVMIDQSGTRLFQADMGLITYRMPFSHQACFILREQFLRQMYDLKYSICGDYDLILNLYERQCTFEYLHTIVCRYDMRGISSRSYINKRREHERILKEHRLNRSKCRFVIHMMEAFIKTLISCIIPDRVQNVLRRFYMDKVKRYKYWEGEIY